MNPKKAQKLSIIWSRFSSLSLFSIFKINPQRGLNSNTGNRGLEIHCHGFGSAVFVAVYIGMCLGYRWHNTKSTFTLWHAWAHRCKIFRNPQVWGLKFQKKNFQIKFQNLTTKKYLRFQAKNLGLHLRLICMPVFHKIATQNWSGCSSMF